MVFSIPNGDHFTTQTAPGSTAQNDSNPDANGVAQFVLGPPGIGNNVTASVAGDNVTAPYIDRTIDAGIVPFRRPATPVVSTTISSTAPSVGSALSDSVTVTGTGGASISGAWKLLGPVAENAGSCSGTSWDNAPIFDSGTLTINAGNGKYTTTSTKKLVGPGCYTFTDSLPATATTESVTTTPGDAAETAIVVPLTPSVSTTVSNQQAGLGAKLTDTVDVTGAAGSSVAGTWTLHGPVPAVSGACTSVQWAGAPVAASGTFTVTLAGGVGSVTTAATTVTSAGCYTYTEALNAGPATAAVSETAAGAVSETALIAQNIPTLTTTVSAAQPSIGSTVTDNITVANSAGASTTASWNLLGPVAPTSAGTCAGVDWAGAATFDQGTLAINGDGQYSTAPSKTITTAGCYTYVDSVPATTNTTSVVGQPGVASETALAVSYAIGDYVWYDTTNNGIQDSSELPVPEVTVTLEDTAGNVLATTTTNVSGYYHFDNLRPSEYVVVFTPPAGYVFTTENAAGSTPTNDSNVDSSGRTATIHLGPNDTELTPSIPSDEVKARLIDRTIDAGIFSIVTQPGDNRQIPTSLPPSTTGPTRLAFTGVDASALTTTALLLVAAGLILMFTTRRRRQY